jgi:hypothetical protein
MNAFCGSEYSDAFIVVRSLSQPMGNDRKTPTLNNPVFQGSEQITNVKTAKYTSHRSSVHKLTTIVARRI